MYKRHGYFMWNGDQYWFVFFYNTDGVLIGYRSHSWSRKSKIWLPHTKWFNNHID